MDAIDFVKEYKRMCKNGGKNCSMCSLRGKVCYIIDGGDSFEYIVNEVEKWSKENPQKTMAQDFFEKHPNAPKSSEGVPQVCAYNCGYTKKEGCKGSIFCCDCWNQPIE